MSEARKFNKTILDFLQKEAVTISIFLKALVKARIYQVQTHFPVFELIALLNTKFIVKIYELPVFALLLNIYNFHINFAYAETCVKYFYNINFHVEMLKVKIVVKKLLRNQRESLITFSVYFITLMQYWICLDFLNLLGDLRKQLYKCTFLKTILYNLKENWVLITEEDWC